MFPMCKLSHYISFRLKKDILKDPVFTSFVYVNPFCFTFTNKFLLVFFAQQQGAEYKGGKLSFSFFAIKKGKKTTHEFTYTFENGSIFNVIFVFKLLLYKTT